MGKRISQVIPSIYYYEENDLIRFVDALDVETDLLEQEVKSITDLINVDKCPDDKLAYLAALTNCPLIGNDPELWRRQIKNWPHLLKMKGTELSLDIFLNSIDAQVHEIRTYFRDASGELITQKPKGDPFYDKSTEKWRNIRTHLFGLDVTWDNDRYRTWQTWNQEFIDKISIWLERAKPFHAELYDLNLYILNREDLELYYGIGENLGGWRKIGLSTLDRTDAKKLYYGVAENLSGEHKIGISRVKDRMTLLNPYVASLLSGEVRVSNESLSEFDRERINMLVKEMKGD